jgi:uncharacterized protein with HEPN domain
MSRSPLEYLKHIYDELLYLDQTSRAISSEEFSANPTYQKAFSRSLEIIGEATKQLSPEFCESHREIPWSYMAKMRDKLIHHYLGVDYEMIWQTVVEDIPQLRDSVNKIITELEK